MSLPQPTILTYEQFRGAFLAAHEAAELAGPDTDGGINETAFGVAIGRFFEWDIDLAGSFMQRYLALNRLCRCDLLGPYTMKVQGGAWFHDAALGVAAYFPLTNGEFDSTAFIEAVHLASATIHDAAPC